MAKKKSQKKEIIWNLINSGLAGALVLLGAFSANSITWKSVGVAIIAALTVAFGQFKKYWESEQAEYSCSKSFGSFL